jgi:hypothetical protein
MMIGGDFQEQPSAALRLNLGLLSWLTAARRQGERAPMLVHLVGSTRSVLVRRDPSRQHRSVAPKRRISFHGWRFAARTRQHQLGQANKRAEVWPTRKGLALDLGLALHAYKRGQKGTGLFRGSHFSYSFGDETLSGVFCFCAWVDQLDLFVLALCNNAGMLFG